jgi:uncharacterized metal-binding protein YceD (DUF177 family)
MTAKAKNRLEFSRPLLVNRVPRKGSHEVFAADPKECAALATRFSIPALHSLKAHLIATPWRGGGLKVTGDIEADLDQVSVISLEPFRSKPRFKVERFFLPEKMIVDAAEDDVDPIENDEVDLGELVAEAVALELDPYPKRPDEDFGDHIEDDTVVVELKPSPFAKLQKIVEDDD